MTLINTRLQAVHQRIATAARLAGRDPGTIRLLAVSKTWPAEAVAAALSVGQTAFGENYVQEACLKIHALAASHLEWHFIGPLQRNKTRLVAENFAWVHSLDRLNVAERLAAQRPPEHGPLQVCLQVNISDEASKEGCCLEEASRLAHAIAVLPGLHFRGLMCIPRFTTDPIAQRLAFRRLRLLAEQLRAEGLSCDTLSMGMSHDLEAAIEEGSTLLRVGTAIFGERNRT